VNVIEVIVAMGAVAVATLAHRSEGGSRLATRGGFLFPRIPLR
jgi:hypothetical protein